MSEQHVSKNQSTDLDTSSKDEIDLVEILCKIIVIRKKIYKVAGIGLIIGVIVALSIPKQYTVKVTLSPEMGSSRGTNGLAGLAASFLGSGATTGDGSDALNASLSSFVSSIAPLFTLLSISILLSSSNNDLILLMIIPGNPIT